jgi:Fic family protein
VPTLIKRQWRADLEAFGGRKARRGFFYKAFVPDRIADLELSIPTDVAEAAVVAETAVRDLGAQPPGKVSWEALARQLLRTESVASSRIEGLEISHRRLARAAFGRAHRDLTAESVLGNVTAMETAIDIGGRQRPLASRDVLVIHRALLKATPDHHLGGKLRTAQGWVGGGATPGDADFIPPPEDHVAGLLDDLCTFASRDDVPAVIQAGIVHAQFETIHPFPDGNGRVGRCLIHVLLRRRGLTPGFVPPVSLVLGANARAYVRGLVEYRAGRIAEWCGTFCAAVRTAAKEAKRLGSSVEDLQSRWRIAAKAPRPDSAAHHIIDALPGQPILDVGTAEQLAGVSNQAARLALMDLEGAGVIRRINTGRRNRAWEAVGLFELVDSFERRLRSSHAIRS